MHSKHECNHLLATHEAAVAVACMHYGNHVSCGYCSCDCHYCGCNCSYNMDQAAANTTTATTATTATASTPTLRSNTSNTIMAYVNGQYAHGMHWGRCTLRLLELGAMYVTAACNVYRCCHCTLQPTKRVQTASCKLQAANCKLPTANCKPQAVLLWHRNLASTHS